MPNDIFLDDLDLSTLIEHVEQMEEILDFLAPHDPPQALERWRGPLVIAARA